MKHMPLRVHGSAGRFLHPEHIIQELGIFQSNTVVADFGAGAGYFALAVAKAIGPSGRVRAVDIRKPALDLLESHAKHAGLYNITAIHGDIEQKRGTKLPDMSVNIVLLVNVLYQAGSKDAVFSEAFRILAPKGYLVVLEWDPEAYLGPPKNMRLARKTVTELAEQQGLKLDRTFPDGKAHYGLLFKKS